MKVNVKPANSNRINVKPQVQQPRIQQPQPQQAYQRPQQPQYQEQLTTLLGQQQEPTEINVVKAFFVEVPPENALHYRPMEINTTQAGINYLQEAVSINAGMVTPASIREIARDIIAPSRQSHGEIGIAETWGNSRLAFYILFEERTRNMITRSVITGYTNHSDVGIGNGNALIVDPNMALYITSHLNLGQTVVTGGRFSGQGQQSLSAHNIIRPVNIKTVTSGVKSVGKTLRPTDVSSYISGMEIDPNIIVSGNNSALGKNTLGIASDRKNEISSQYLSKLLRANIIGNNAIASENMSMDFADTSLYNSAAAASGYIREYSLHSSNLMNELMARTSYTAAGFVYMSELQRLWPNIINVSHVARLDKRAATDNRNIGADWSIPSQTTVVAHALTHAIPALLTHYHLVTIDFVATNQVMNGGMSGSSTQVGIKHATGMFDDEGAVAAKVKHYENAIIEDILSELFTHGESFHIEGQFTLFGSSFTNISINGSPMEPNTFPNYAGSLSSNVVIASDREGQEKSVSAKQLIDHVV